MLTILNKSRIALGTVQFGLPYGIANQDGQVNRATAKDMLKLAASSGIDTLDTAITYGESEACLGEIGTNGFKLVTKLPAVPAGCVDVKIWIQEQVTKSLVRLGVDAVHGLLLHRPEQLLGTDGKVIYQTLQNLKETGQIQKVGVSIYDPSVIRTLIPQYKLDIVQAPFNLVDRRLYTSGCLQLMKDQDVEIHTRSVFLQGLLLVSQAGMPAKFSPWADLWSKWYKWLADYNISAVQACLALPAAFPEIDRIVVGADSVSQLTQIVSAATSVTPIDLPDLTCVSEDIINPARWNAL
jgi:aryl-alcohol dehydrogenase-like predicted oxidoreductase